MADDPFAWVDEFALVYPVWVITPDPPPAGMEQIVAKLLTGRTATGGYVPVFTDRDLGERFANQMEGPGGEEMPAQLMSVRTPESLLRLLDMMTAAGHTQISFDPEEHLDRPIPIWRAIARVRGPL